jgi:hypothetical protein
MTTPYPSSETTDTRTAFVICADELDPFRSDQIAYLSSFTANYSLDEPAALHGFGISPPNDPITLIQRFWILQCIRIGLDGAVKRVKDKTIWPIFRTWLEERSSYGPNAIASIMNSTNQRRILGYMEILSTAAMEDLMEIHERLLGCGLPDSLWALIYGSLGEKKVHWV